MANTQSNPGFVTGQIPSAAQWNSYFTKKQDALLNTVYLTGPITQNVANTACKYVCDTSAGDVTLTYSPGLGQSGHENSVKFVKRSADKNNTNKVIITGGSENGVILNENNAGGAGWLVGDADGTDITFTGVP